MTNPFDYLEKRLDRIETLISGLNFIAQTEVKEEYENPLTVNEAADFLGLTVPTMYSKVSRGELPVNKRGKRLYFFKSELLGYLREGRIKSNIEIEADAETLIINKN